MPGADQEAELVLTVEEAYWGGRRCTTLSGPGGSRVYEGAVVSQPTTPARTVVRAYPLMPRTTGPGAVNVDVAPKVSERQAGAAPIQMLCGWIDETLGAAATRPGGGGGG